MSDQPAPSAPVDTTAIASHALESLEQAQSTPSPTTQAAPQAASPTAQADAKPQESVKPGAPAIDLSEAETLLREQGYATERKPDGREHWIPRSKVLKMIETGLKKRAEALDKERTTWQQREAQGRQMAQQLAQWRHLVETDPQALLQRLASLDPRYTAFLQRQAAQAQEAEDPEPEPDLDLGAGRFTYSTDGIRKLRAWERRQMEKTVNERLAPFQQRVQQEQQQQRRAQVDQMLRERTTASLSKARSWPRFSEHEAQILKVLQEDSAQSEAQGIPPQKTLHDAYMEVVPQTFMADHNSVREQVLAELNRAPRSTSVTGNGAEPMRKPGPLTTEEIARRALARLEGRG